MSQYSLDSLENDSSCQSEEFFTRSRKGCDRNFSFDNVEHFEDIGDDLFLCEAPNITERADGLNEPTKFKTPRENERSGECHENAVIASTNNVTRESCSPTDKLGARTRFWAGRPAGKKFDVPERSSLSTSSSEFRNQAHRARNYPDHVGRFMKAVKKLGNVHPASLDSRKKSVSYLELYRRRFGAESRRCAEIPKGPTPSICGDGPDERYIDGEKLPSSNVSGDDDESELGFYRRVMELGNRGSRQTRSCETLDRCAANESVSKSNTDVSGSLSDSMKPVNLRRRVIYKPYSIEDYKSLGVPQSDRSLGPDRIEMESKAESLMRRKSYGDSVSARNRQRIHRRSQKLKEERADSQKIPLHPLTDPEQTRPASKINIAVERNDNEIRTSSSAKQIDKKLYRRCYQIKKLFSITPEKNQREPEKKSKKIDSSLYEIVDDTPEDVTNLRKLRQRHIEEKRTIDFLLKRS